MSLSELKLLDPIDGKVIEEVQRISRLNPSNVYDAKIDACEYLLRNLGISSNGNVTVNAANVDHYLWIYVRRLLNAGQYREAANFLWGQDLFTVKPRSVRMVWDEIPTTAQLLVMGHGAAGKSFTIVTWLILDWLRDPEYTTIKLISSTGSSADATLKSHIANFHRMSYLPFPGKLTATYLGLDTKERKFGIERLAIPQGEDAKARLRGKCHPFPRLVPHPIFGGHSRSRVYIDEAEAVSEGVWEEVQNVLNSKEGAERTKVIASSNPKDSSSRYGILCQHKSGWEHVINNQIEKWVSMAGWNVLWLDGAKCENVVEKNIIYPGLLTYDGFMQYYNMGDLGPEGWTMARGMFPQSGHTALVISQNEIDKNVGFVNFLGQVNHWASIDVALDGGDKPIMTVGRFGMASGWHKPDGEVFRFESARNLAQVDNQFPLANGDTLEICTEIMRVLKELNIKGEYISIDATGNGAGVFDVLKPKYSHNILGIEWNTKATETKIMEEDTRTCYDLFNGVPSEMWFAAQKWLEFGYIKIHPILLNTSFTHELTTRRYFQAELKKRQVEAKDAWKSRNSGRSPDRADSFLMGIHLLRMRKAMETEMLPNAPEKERAVFKSEMGIVDKLEFMSFDT